MKVKMLKELPGYPPRDSVGEALYFRHNADDEIVLHVLFYGFPGIYQVKSDDVESIRVSM